MKRSRFFFLAIILLSGLLTSCQPDAQPTPADDRDVYVASWTCSEHSSQVGVSSFTVHINKSTTSTSQVLIENFYNLGFSYKAVTDISGTSMTIGQQTLNGNQLHGSGTKSGTNTINLTYYVNNGSTIDTCTATLTRQ
jgi:hypothetical protein